MKRIYELASKYGVQVNETKTYPSFTCKCEDIVTGIRWSEYLNIFEEFGKTCVMTITGMRYYTYCRYLDEPITNELIERELKSFVKSIYFTPA